MRTPSLQLGAGDKPETGKRSLSFPNRHEAATPEDEPPKKPQTSMAASLHIAEHLACRRTRPRAAPVMASSRPEMHALMSMLSDTVYDLKT